LFDIGVIRLELRELLAVPILLTRGALRDSSARQRLPRLVQKLR
jgi:hypothetical protein